MLNWIIVTVFDKLKTWYSFSASTNLSWQQKDLNWRVCTKVDLEEELWLEKKSLGE